MKSPSTKGVILGLFGLIVSLSAQIEFHGHVYPLARLTLEQKYLSLPHRIVSIEGHQRGKKVSLFFNTTLEYRLSTNSTTFELQEAYADFSTVLGDIRLGQQVVTWGAADGNNPTDNVNAYDFYYLFMGGGDRKQGNLMASANLYFGNLNLEAVLTPVFQPNRLPIGEPDFPFLRIPYDSNLERRPSQSMENTEAGVRIRIPMNIMDISLSYFSGFDRMFSPLFSQVPGQPAPIFTGYGYYRTQVFGGDLVTFLRDWAFRAEGAFFQTEDSDGINPYIRNPYLQYVLQVDRADENSNIVFQYLGTYITKIDDEDVFNPVVGTISEKENEKDIIPPKMGMPFASIAQNAIMATASYDLSDGLYTLQGQALYEFDNDGYMVGGKLTIALEDAFDLELGLTYMDGKDGSMLATVGDAFSHFYVAMKYSF